MADKRTRLIVALVFAAIMLFAFSLTLSAQETEEEKDSAFFVNLNYLYSIDFVHSVPEYDFLSAAFGYEKMMSEWWSFKGTIEPIVYGSGSVDSRYGSGISGYWTAYFNRDSEIKPYFEFEAGVVLFDEPVPIPDATQFNFVLGLGTGFEIPIKGNDYFTIGYRFRHMSNSNLGDRNPAVNGHLFTVGYKYRF